MAQSNEMWNMLNELATKKGITEIVVNDANSIFVEINGRFTQLSGSIKRQDAIDFVKEVAQLNNRSINPSYPMFDGTLPDGSRINVVLPPVVKKFPAITIRKYLKKEWSLDNDPMVFGLGPVWVQYIKATVKARMNIIVSGGTGVGKTTFLNLLINEIPKEDRIITIEDTLELQVHGPHRVRLEASGHREEGVTIRDLVINSLRMRPDRIIIGETRGGEIFDLFQAMNTGHDGSMSSIHSNNTRECLQRMETLFLMSGMEIPYHVVRRQMATAVNLIIQIGRGPEGERVVTRMSELTGVEGDQILTQDIAIREDGELARTGLVPSRIKELVKTGIIPEDFFN